VSQAQDQGIADSESDGQMRAAAALLEHQGKIKKRAVGSSFWPTVSPCLCG